VTEKYAILNGISGNSLPRLRGTSSLVILNRSAPCLCGKQFSKVP